MTEKFILCKTCGKNISENTEHFTLEDFEKEEYTKNIIWVVCEKCFDEQMYPIND